MRISVVIPAAGKGRRAGFSENKIFHLLPDGRTVLERAASAFFPFADEVIIAADPAEEGRVRALFGSRVRVVTGGKTRTDSVRRALETATGEIVLVHDAARPYVSEAVIRDCIASVKKYGSGIPALPTADTVCAAEGGEMTFSYGKTLFAVQTPQGFYTEDLRRAYRLAKGEYADDSAVYAAFCRPPRLYAGGAENRKLTFAADFPPRYAVGEGFDCHAFAAGRKLVLGGVEIPHDRGLLGHSDADVLTHAVMDALLSAVGEGDIGVQFPDTDPAYRGISSMLLLERVMQIVARKGRRVESLSAVLMAEKPKLKNFLPAIAENLAVAVGIPYVGLSVTTLEGLGFVGREEGICARASVLLRENG